MKNPANAGFFLFKEIYTFKIFKKNKKKSNNFNNGIIKISIKIVYSYIFSK